LPGRSAARLAAGGEPLTFQASICSHLIRVANAEMSRVNRPQDEKELEWLRQCVLRGRPYGDDAWVRRTAAKLGLESSLRPVGRPRKTPEKSKNGF
jgi:hypothetical protein